MVCVGKFIDVIFCRGKLYMFSSSELTEDLFSLELSDDDGGGLMVSRVERRDMDMPEVTEGYYQNWSVVEWRGKLIVVATYTTGAEVWQRIAEVRVFEASLSAQTLSDSLRSRAWMETASSSAHAGCKSFRSSV